MLETETQKHQGKLMRHIIYILLICSSLNLTAEVPSVGAIRWDAWTGGKVTEAVERTLGPEKYHDRLPWFAKVTGENKVHIDGSSQKVMDKEIQFASDAGIDYWAFLLYPEASPMSTAIGQYLKSTKRSKINFCFILRNILGVSQAEWPKERDRALALLKQPGYQTVMNGRSLVYIFRGKNDPMKRFSEFRQAAFKMGMNPYFVYMGWNPAVDFKKFKNKGFDAVSSYAKSSKRAKFSGLVKEVKRDWGNAARKNVPYIPLVTTGWDKKPRQENAVPWEKDAHYLSQKVFPASATPEEIALHLKEALLFVNSNPTIFPANTIIIYAWNEFDEGGWISPTWQKNGKPNTSRIDAIRKVLLPH